MAKISAVTKMLKIANRTLLSLREAAKLYNVSVNTLSKHAKIGTLPTQRVTGFRVVFVDIEDLERWMQEHYQQKRAQRARQWWAKRKQRKRKS
jgi:predicted DNA-binding transcriptional regulator AlpA